MPGNLLTNVIALVSPARNNAKCYGVLNGGPGGVTFFRNIHFIFRDICTNEEETVPGALHEYRGSLIIVRALRVERTTTRDEETDHWVLT